MAEHLKKGRAKFFWVKVREELAGNVGVAHRAEFQNLAREERVLASHEEGSEVIRLVKPQGVLSTLRKACVTILGSAPAPSAT